MSRGLLISIRTYPWRLVIEGTVDVWTVVESAVSAFDRAPSALVRKVPLEASERPMLVTLVLEKSSTLLHSEFLQISGRNFGANNIIITSMIHLVSLSVILSLSFSLSLHTKGPYNMVDWDNNTEFPLNQSSTSDYKIIDKESFRGNNVTDECVHNRSSVCTNSKNQA